MLAQSVNHVTLDTSPSPTKNIYDINFCYCHVILTTIVTITYIGKLWMITTVTQLFIVQYSLRQQRQPRRFAICRQIATFPKAEFVAAHSRKGGICCGSQPQRRNLLRLTAANTSLFAYRSLGGNVLCCSSYTIASTSATAV